MSEEKKLNENWKDKPLQMVRKKIIYEQLDNKPKYTGYGYHGGGRPRKDTEARRVTISISGTPSEIEKLKELAAGAGLSVSRFVLDNLTK